MPSAAQLARMRAQITENLPDTCIILSITRSVDSAGRVTETLAAVTGGTVVCRMDTKPRKYLTDTGGKLVVALDHTLTLPYDAPIAADRIIRKNGNDYRITALAEDESFQLDRRVSVERIQ
jgi:hypothetical protein